MESKSQYFGKIGSGFDINQDWNVRKMSGQDRSKDISSQYNLHQTPHTILHRNSS